MKFPFVLLTALAGHCWLPPVGLLLGLHGPLGSEQMPGVAGLEKGICDVLHLPVLGGITEFPY